MARLQRQVEREADESSERAEEVFRKMKAVQAEYVNVLNEEMLKRKEADNSMSRRIEEKAERFKQEMAVYHKQKDDEMKELYDFIEVSLVE